MPYDMHDPPRGKQGLVTRQGYTTVRRMDTPKPRILLAAHILGNVLLSGGELHRRGGLGTAAAEDAASDGLPLEIRLRSFSKTTASKSTVLYLRIHAPLNRVDQIRS